MADKPPVVRAIGLRSTAFPKAERGFRPSAGSARNRSANRPLPTTFPLRGKGPGANPEARFLLYKPGIVKTSAWDQGQKLWLASSGCNGYSRRILLQTTSLRLAFACLIAAFLASCATQPSAHRNAAK